MNERQEPNLDQIMQQWLCLWQMSLQLMAFTPNAFVRAVMRLP